MRPQVPAAIIDRMFCADEWRPFTKVTTHPGLEARLSLLMNPSPHTLQEGLRSSRACARRQADRLCSRGSLSRY